MTQTSPHNKSKSTYDDEVVRIIVQDRITLGQLSIKLEELDWSETMAVGLTAYHRINQTSTQLIDIKPRYGAFNAPVAEAMELLNALSPSALAELAADILQDDLETEE